MRVLITGAAGFIGQLLAQTLLNDEEGKYTVILTDIIEPPIPKNVQWPQQAKSIKADLLTGSQSVADKSLDAAFLFHGIMSSGAEANFDLGKHSPAFQNSAISFTNESDRNECQLRCDENPS